jgi:hypothetical protein
MSFDSATAEDLAELKSDRQSAEFFAKDFCVDH